VIKYLMLFHHEGNDVPPLSTQATPPSIEYVVGDATAPLGKGPRTIVQVCNDGGGWGRGFVLAVSKRWREPEEQYRRWSQGGGAKPFQLGEVEFVLVEPDLWIANLIGQRGTRPKQGLAPVRYDAIRTGLAAVREFARLHSSSVHMPRIGAGLAGGRWEEIASIVKEELVDHDVAVVVYDLPTTTD
jgi:O-acetyl-ADP-ribose deacetylase (regulator of RNase III)